MLSGRSGSERRAAVLARPPRAADRRVARRRARSLRARVGAPLFACRARGGCGRRGLLRAARRTRRSPLGSTAGTNEPASSPRRSSSSAARALAPRSGSSCSRAPTSAVAGLPLLARIARADRIKRARRLPPARVPPRPHAGRTARGALGHRRRRRGPVRARAGDRSPAAAPGRAAESAQRRADPARRDRDARRSRATARSIRSAARSTSRVEIKTLRPVDADVPLEIMLARDRRAAVAGRRVRRRVPPRSAPARLVAPEGAGRPPASSGSR